MPTTLADATAAIEARLLTDLAPIPVSVPNVPFTVPATGVWVQVWVLGGAAFHLTQAADQRNQVPLSIQCTLYTPKSTGQGPLLRLADTIRGLFSREAIAAGGEEVRCGIASALRYPNEQTIDNRAWWVGTVTIPCTIEETT